MMRDKEYRLLGIGGKQASGKLSQLPHSSIREAINNIEKNSPFPCIYEKKSLYLQSKMIFYSKTTIDYEEI
jgi:hypothetical protein